jgi:ligand-binding SRPBCC domain-containing protein
MATHTYKAEQFLPITISEAWTFFSSPDNLPLITPPELQLQMITKDIKEIYDGLEIEYRVKPLFGIALKWKSLIQNVQAPSEFTDLQLKGPYSLWQHRHQLIPHEKGVLIVDTVLYKLPFGFIGELLHQLIIKSKIDRIFSFRREVLEHKFVNNV